MLPSMCTESSEKYERMDSRLTGVWRVVKYYIDLTLVLSWDHVFDANLFNNHIVFMRGESIFYEKHVQIIISSVSLLLQKNFITENIFKIIWTKTYFYMLISLRDVQCTTKRTSRRNIYVIRCMLASLIDLRDPGVRTMSWRLASQLVMCFIYLFLYAHEK